MNAIFALWILCDLATGIIFQNKVLGSLVLLFPDSGTHQTSDSKRIF